MPHVRAVQERRLAIILSRPLETQESSAIGRQERAEDLSFFPTLGIMATFASFQDWGK